MDINVLQVQGWVQSYVPCCCRESAQNSSNFGIVMKILRHKQSKYAVCKKNNIMSYKFGLFSQSSRQHDNNCCSDPTLVFSIGAARNNAENRLHTNNTRSPSFSYLIIGTTSSKDNGGYEFQFSNEKKYNRLILNAADANPTSAFSIGAARNNGENRLLTNNTRSPFFSCLIIAAASSKENGGYKCVLSNNKCI